MPADETMELEPTPAEIDDWAARERERREAWLRGPSEEERAAYVRRERERRLARLGRRDTELEARLIAREMLLYPRELQLAAEGAMSRLWRWYRHWMRDLVRAGLEWEEDLGRPPRRHRVPLEDDDR
jgi:hypothetical protein